MEDKYYLIKLANNDREYENDVTHCGSSIDINGKEIPIVVVDENGTMYEFLTNREIAKNIANPKLNFYTHVNGLSFIDLERVSSDFLKEYKDIVTTLTPGEIIRFDNILSEIDERSKILYDKNNNQSDFGLGQVMSRKLFKKSS